MPRRKVSRNWRCKICGELVHWLDRTDHILEHARRGEAEFCPPGFQHPLYGWPGRYFEKVEEVNESD